MSTFLVIGAVVGACVGGYQGIAGVRKYNHKITDKFWENVAIVNRQYSYAQNELDKQAVYARDEAQSEMYQLSLNAFRNNSLVESALSESGLEGRSQKAVARDVRGQSERQKDNIQASYENAIYSIKSQKDSLHIEYAQNIQDMRDAIKPLYKHGFQAIDEIGQKAAIGAVAGYFGAGVGGAAFGAIGGSAGGATGGAASGAVTGSAGSIAGMGAGSGLSVPASTLGSTATTGLSSGATSWGLSAGGASLSSAGGSTLGSSAGGAIGSGLSVSPSVASSWGAGASSGFNWGQFASQTLKYYNTANKYYNYYQQFRSKATEYYGNYYNTNRYQRRRGYYY